MKRSDKPLGNLPMEIMAYLSAYVETVQNNGQMKSTVLGGQVSKSPPHFSFCPLVFLPFEPTESQSQTSPKSEFH